MVNVNNSVQGDAHLLIDSGINTLIDAGTPEEGSNYLVPYLRTIGVTTIHHLFVSHPHTDHYGGLNALIDAGIRLENIYYNLPPEGSDDFNYKRHEFMETLTRCSNSGAATQDISKGFSLNFPNSKFKVLHAQKDSRVNGQQIDINDYSLIVQWDAGKFRTLFTGDLNFRLGTELAKHSHIKADILKVPHHGVTGIPPDAFFDIVSPSLAMFPSTDVLWNHPRGEQAKSWTLRKKIYYCHNGLNGTVVLKLSDSITAVSDQESASCPNGGLAIIPGDKIDESTDFSIVPALNLLID